LMEFSKIEFPFKRDLMEWLCLVYKEEKEVIENWVCIKFPSFMPHIQA
jgi:hypothetical protein